MGKKEPAMADNKKPIDDEGKRTLGLVAGNEARKMTEEACMKVGLTREKVAKAVVDGLKATQVKVQFAEGWQVSEPFVDNSTRMRAVEHGITLLDMKPVERKQVDLVKLMTDEEIDKRLALLTGTDQL